MTMKVLQEKQKRPAESAELPEGRIQEATNSLSSNHTQDISNRSSDLQPREVSIASIIVDPALQARVAICEEAVERYAELFREAGCWCVPPLNMVSGWLVDGNQRLLAAQRAGLKSVLAIRVAGTREDAIRAMLAANSNHGVPRSREDLWRAISICEQTWPNLTTREVADVVKCSPQTVLNWRNRQNLSKLDKNSEQAGDVVVTNAIVTNVSKNDSESPVATSGSSTEPVLSKLDNAELDTSKPPREKIYPKHAKLKEGYDDWDGVEIPEALYPLMRDKTEWSKVLNDIRSGHNLYEAADKLIELGNKHNHEPSRLLGERLKREFKSLLDAIWPQVQDIEPRYLRGDRLICESERRLEQEAHSK